MNVSVILAILSVFYFFSVVPTIFRLIYRARNRQLWWDDFWAAISMICAALLYGSYVQFYPGLPQTFLGTFTAIILTSKLALWASRLSIAVTIVRILAVGKWRLFSKLAALLFGILGVTVTIQKIALCRPPNAYLCGNKPIIPAYTELAATFLADFWLLFAPAYLLWNMKLKKQVHRLLQVIFACELSVLVTSILGCVYVVKNDFLSQGLLTHFRVTVSLIVCNLLFLVTYVYRLSQRGEDENADEPTPSDAPPHPQGQVQPQANEHSRVTSTTTCSQTTQLNPLTSVYISDSSDSRVRTGSLHLHEPGRSDRPWRSSGTTRFTCSV